MREVLNPSHFDFFGPISFLEGVGILLPAFLLILGDANMYQRFFSARSEGSGSPSGSLAAFRCGLYGNGDHFDRLGGQFAGA